MKHKTACYGLAAAAGLALVVALGVAASRAANPRYRLQSTTGGLGRMSNDKVVLDSTLFQAAPGYSRNDKYELQAGFWALPLPTPSSTTPLYPTPPSTAQPLPTSTLTPTLTVTPTATITASPTLTPTATAPIPPPPLYLPLVVKNQPPPPTPTATPIATASPTATPTPRALVGHDTCPGELINSNWDLIAQDFGHADDRDWFAFDAAAGAIYHIETMHLELQADTTLELYGLGCGKIITHSDDIEWSVNLASRLVWTAPAAGRYHIRVVPFDWRVYGAGTGYDLLIERVADGS